MIVCFATSNFALSPYTTSCTTSAGTVANAAIGAEIALYSASSCAAGYFIVLNNGISGSATTCT